MTQLSKTASQLACAIFQIPKLDLFNWNFYEKNRIKWLIAPSQIAMLAATASALGASEKVYVADEDANSADNIDAVSSKKIGSVAVGQVPHNIQASNDGKLVWVTNNGELGRARCHDARKNATAR